MRSLEAYEKKRDFDLTPEPRAELVEAGGDRLSFVVQKHDARRLHFDFRLEWNGVLLSWAVTKGPSTDPSQKRLSVRTEDHPVAYGGFEGTIPENEYGGGTVMLWDNGWWEPLHDPEEGLKEGKLHFRLHGARMKGGWALIRMRAKKGERRENWLLIKERDDFAGRSADALTNKHRTSVTTGRAMRDIAKERAPQKPAKHGKPLPRFQKLQLATLRDAPPEGDDWQHEAKFDGYRCLIAVGKGGVRLYSRNGKDWSDRFGDLCEPAAALDCDAALIDGEVIAGGGGGDFSTLQKALKSGDPLTFYAFDCLHLDGKDLTGKPLSERRDALEGLFGGLPPRGPLRMSPVIEGDGAAALAAMCDAGGEGIVSKRTDAPYRGGRAKSWIKAKCIKRAEFVVAGWSPSDKKGRPFSSLILGSFERGRLVYRGRVGTGFDGDDFDALQGAMKPLARKTSPFDADLPAEASDARWVTPKLVVETEYAEFTSEGRIRHGVYQGLREDKEAKDVSAKAEAASDSSDDERKIAGVRVSSTGRVVYPETGLTKGEVAGYYAAVADRMLEHSADRPLSLLRCPDGISGDCFFQKHAGRGFPDGVKSLPVEEKDGDTEDYMYVTAAEGLVGAAQMGTLEFHIWGAQRDRIERPDRMVFDLDPDEGLGFDAVKQAAGDVRDGLAACGLDAAPMVTGGKGVHVVVPLRRVSEWDTVKFFAKTFATVLTERHPDRYTATMSKAKRKGRVFIDWLRNERGATAIAPYSLRARPGAAVATPVTWDELSDLDRPDGFHVAAVQDRLSRACPLGSARARGIGASVVEALEDWSKD
ncbi:DNA ligase D [Maritimibacter sp. UBA3975]|uniref:DNA ligase D n=1 Tax=Maritimibacter sp. UBA3975 TaxID=1946833 RepID=UPI000C08E5A2|nr:DNA ligase D [Maritimibacter sp. UBA3975]MAM62978.1 DNA ligase D [Maritimibacter sp.]|tara:strand:+ start:21528 stop:23972 length:2445 start_codon:yes stop_codon:yes gene_type:complete